MMRMGIAALALAGVCAFALPAAAQTNPSGLPAGIPPSVVGPDDLAMAAALVDVSANLESVYDRRIDRLDTVEQQLKALDAKYGMIAEFLVRSVASLEKAEIFLVVPRDGVTADLRTDIGPAIQRWRETAAAFAQNPNAKDADGQPAAFEVFWALYKDFQRQSRKLAGEGPGVLAAYGQVMGFEFLTGGLVKAPKAERLAAFDQYIAQWSFFLDPKNPASPAGASLAKKTYFGQMQKLLDTADQTLAQDRRFVVEKGHRTSQPCRGGTYGYLQDRLADVSGNGNAGYGYSESWSASYGAFNTCTPSERQCSRCLPDLANTAAILGSVTTDRDWGDVAAKVRFLQDVRAAMPSIRADQDFTDTIVKAANQYAAAAKRWRDLIAAGN